MRPAHTDDAWKARLAALDAALAAAWAKLLGGHAC